MHLSRPSLIGPPALALMFYICPFEDEYFNEQLQPKSLKSRRGALLLPFPVGSDSVLHLAAVQMVPPRRRPSIVLLTLLPPVVNTSLAEAASLRKKKVRDTVLCQREWTVHRSGGKALLQQTCSEADKKTRFIAIAHGLRSKNPKWTRME